MKNFKRNAVVIIVLLFVGAAVYLNWSYNSKETDVSSLKSNENNDTDLLSEDEKQENVNTGLYYDTASDDEVMSEASKKLDSIRLNRQQARDEAKKTFETVSSMESASKEAIDAAAIEVTELTKISVLESELESKILAKGYKDCVVYISEGGVDVTVASKEDPLNASSVAQLTDIITGNSEYKPIDIKISEIK